MSRKEPRVDDYIAKAAGFAQPVLNRIRKLVHAACPDVTEAIKWNSPFYEYKGILLCTPAFNYHCALIFWKGKLLFKELSAKDNPRTRFRRLTSNADLPGDKILTGYIRKAVEFNAAGVKTPRAKPKARLKLAVPDYFLAALKKNVKALTVFENFSPSCQFDYIDWITGAKNVRRRAPSAFRLPWNGSPKGNRGTGNMSEISPSNHVGRFGSDERIKMKISKMIGNTALFGATLILMTCLDPALAQIATNHPSHPSRPPPPTRDPHTPGYVAAYELPDGDNAPVDVGGNFIIGPTHNRAPEMIVNTNVPHGAVYEFTMNSADSKIYPGIARDPNTFGTPDPADPAKLVVKTSHPAPYTRHVSVYVPKQYVPGTAAPFIVGADGPDHALFTALDNLIAEKKVPAMVAISISNGGGDAQGSERGLEYDTMSGKYAEFVETEVVPLVESKCHVTLTKDPDARATIGGSSGGSCALIMAWYHPERYHRVLTYSLTAVNQQWPHNPETPHGAWGFHESIIANSPVKPIRIWMEVGDRDLFKPNSMHDNMHDWVVANENMAKVLAGKGYHYQFVFARNAGHTDSKVKQQTLPEALQWLWKDYQPALK